MRRFAVHRQVLVASAFVAVLMLSAATAAPVNAKAGILGTGISIPNPIGLIGKGIGGALSGVAGDVITALAKSVLQALEHAVQWAATLWTGINTPQLTDGSGQPVGALAFVQNNLAYLAAGLAVFSVLAGAAKIAVEENKSHHARELARFLVVYAMIAAGSAALASALVYACDQMATDLIAKTTANTSFADHMAQMLGLVQNKAGGASGLVGLLAVAFAAIVLGIMAFFTTLVQILLMFVRNGMVVLLIGILPLAAAMSNTEIGIHWFKKAWAWLIAFALYKPAAAVVYAVAFILPAQNGINALLSGIMMLILAVLALPALLRFVVPATAAVAGGGGTGALAVGAAGSMMAMRMPTGAAPAQNATTRGYEAAGGGVPGSDGATGAAAAAGQGPSGLDGGAGTNGQRGGGGPPGAASTSEGGSGGRGATGSPGAAGNGTAAAETQGAPGSGQGAAGSTAAAGGRSAAGSGGAASGGAAAGGGASGASGAAGGAAGGAIYGAVEGGQAIRRTGEQQAGDDGPTGADGRPG